MNAARPVELPSLAILARFRSRCWLCLSPIRGGQLIIKGENGRWCHLSCAESAAADEEGGQ